MAVAPMSASHLDGELRDGRHVLAVRVYYEDTDLPDPPSSEQFSAMISDI